MAKDTSRRQTALLAVAVCAAVGALAWLLGVDRGHGHALDAAAPPTGPHDGTLRGAEGRAPERDARGGPALTGGPAPEARPTHGDVEVRVVGSHGESLEGLAVQVVAADEVDLANATLLGTATTDHRGIVTFADQPLDSSRVARVVGSTGAGEAARLDGNRSGVLVHAARLGVLPVVFVPLDEPHERLRLRHGVPLWIDVGCVESVATRVLVTQGSPLFRDLRPEVDGPYDVRSDASLVTALAPGEPYALRLGVTAKGHAVEPLRWTGRLLPTTEVLQAVVPVRPEARIHVLMPPGVGAGQGADPRIQVSCVAAGGGSLSLMHRAHGGFVRGSLDASGRLVLQGVPHYVGRWVHVAGSAGDTFFEAAGRLPEDPSSVLELRPNVDDQAERRRVVEGEHLFLRVFEQTSRRDDSVFQVTAGKAHAHREGLFHAVAPDDGRIVDDPSRGVPFDVVIKPTHHVIQCLRTGGTVKLGPVEKRTDKNGVARFRGLQPGRHKGWVFGFGAVQSITVDVPTGGVGRHEVTPRWGGTIELTVVDDEDRPLPFASFDVRQPSQAPWACPVWFPKVLEPVAQRVDRFVDAQGRRQLRCVEVGRVQLHVQYGVRRRHVTVDVREDETHRVRVVLPMHREPAPDAAPGKKAK